MFVRRMRLALIALVIVACIAAPTLKPFGCVVLACTFLSCPKSCASSAAVNPICRANPHHHVAFDGLVFRGGGPVRP
jgi:hypothetical protein